MYAAQFQVFLQVYNQYTAQVVVLVVAPQAASTAVEICSAAAQAAL